MAHCGHPNRIIYTSAFPAVDVRNVCREKSQSMKWHQMQHGYDYHARARGKCSLPSWFPKSKCICATLQTRHITKTGHESIQKIIRKGYFFIFLFLMSASSVLLCSRLHSTLSSYFWLLSKSSFKSFGFSFARSSRCARPCSRDCGTRLKGTAQSLSAPVSLRHVWHAKHMRRGWKRKDRLLFVRMFFLD